MTSALVASIETYQFNNKDRLFFDASIWLTIEPPAFAQPRPGDAIYTQAFKRILLAKSKIFVDAVVLSEVVNRWLRYSWEASDRAVYPTFKVFRHGSDCRRIAKDLGAACRRLLRNAESVDTGFRSMAVGEILSDVESGVRDFNDGVIAATCDARGFTLVTHDADFRGARAKILTANPKLLKR